MDIILKKDVANLGYANDLVTVKSGYARNYLIPKGYAISANERNKKILAENLKQKAYKEDKIRKEAETIAQALEGAGLKIAVKASSTGKIFGSVNSIIIANAIKEQKKLDIDRKKINLDDDHIKDVGQYKAVVKLHKDIVVEVELDVVAE